MSTEKKSGFTFSKDITLGDLCIALGLIVPFSIWLCSLEFRAESHEKTLAQHELAIQKVNDNQQQIAISQAQTAVTLASISTIVNSLVNQREYGPTQPPTEGGHR